MIWWHCWWIWFLIFSPQARIEKGEFFPPNQTLGPECDRIITLDRIEGQLDFAHSIYGIYDINMWLISMFNLLYHFASCLLNIESKLTLPRPCWLHPVQPVPDRIFWTENSKCSSSLCGGVGSRSVRYGGHPGGYGHSAGLEGQHHLLPVHEAEHSQDLQHRCGSIFIEFPSW